MLDFSSGEIYSGTISTARDVLPGAAGRVVSCESTCEPWGGRGDDCHQVQGRAAEDKHSAFSQACKNSKLDICFNVGVFVDIVM